MLGVLVWTAPVMADENYVHTFTGFTFPPKVGVFKRVQITPFNEAHSDIEVDYNNDPYTVHLSVYVYPAQGFGLLKKHYEDCETAVTSAHPAAQLLEEKPMALTKAGETYNGFSALFSFRDKFVGDTDQDLLSQVLLFQRGDYFVLFRISYVQADKTAAEAAITAFIDALAWPTGDKGLPPPA